MQYKILRLYFLNRYANELRYALIYATFVKPIRMQISPQDFQIRHQIKIMDPRESFDIQLRERLEKIATESIIRDGKKIKGK